MKDHLLQVGDKVTPRQVWVLALPTVPKLRSGGVYCVAEVQSLTDEPGLRLLGVRGDRRSYLGDEWPAWGFRLVNRVEARKEAP